MAYRRKRQKDISIIPVVAIMGLGLWASINQSQWNLTLLLLGLLLLVIAIFAIGFLLDKKKKDRIRKSGIAEIDKMSGLDFEVYLKLLLEKRGYEHVKLTTAYDLA